MAVMNHETREVSFKLVYCGPPMAGKTTSLSHIHSRLGSDQRSDLAAQPIGSDRTLFFDFLPAGTVVLDGYRTKFLLYTVPGQVCYSATRQMVLRGADGIIFVADSRLERMEENVSAWRGMLRNLADNGVGFDDIPVVLQLNKRDLPDITPQRNMEYSLSNGPHRLPVFEAAASTGHNVFTALNTLAQNVLRIFHERNGPVLAPH